MHEIVVVGTSLGGLRVLQALLGELPPNFPLPVVVVQHRSKESDNGLAKWLGSSSRLAVGDAEDKQPLLGGTVYLAPADYHLLVEPGRCTISTDEPVHFARPSVDVLFESAADSYGAKTVAVLLTGASADGARGMDRIKRCGGLTIVQDPATAECPTMPEAALAATKVDMILPVDEIAGFLFRRFPGP